MGFHKVTIQLTDRQMKVLMNEAAATGLRVTTICRMIVHDAIFSGQADKHARMAAAARRAEISRQSLAERLDEVEVPQ